jgi:hypothetical protein
VAGDLSVALRAFGGLALRLGGFVGGFLLFRGCLGEGFLLLLACFLSAASTVWAFEDLG